MNIPLRRRHLAALACAVLAAPAVAGAFWTPAVEVGTTEDTGSGISVAINPSGAAIAGWSKRSLFTGTGPTAVQFAFRPIDGAFGPAVNVDPAAPEFTNPDVPVRQSTDNALTAIGTDGTATAIWMGVSNGDLRIAQTANGVFPAPVNPATALTSDLRSDHSVNGHVAIVNHDGFLAYKTAAAAAWGQTSFGGGNVREATVAVSSTGKALIAWIDNTGRVKARPFNLATGAFSGPTQLVAADNALAPSSGSGIVAGIDASNRGVVVWRKTIAGREIVRAAFLKANATLRVPGVRSVSPLSKRAGQFDAAMAPNGNATIVWTRRDSAIAGIARGPVFTARRSPVALNWTAPALVAAGATGTAIGPPSVSMAKTLTYVTWFKNPANGFLSGTIEAARRVGTGAWARTTIDPSVDDRGLTFPKVQAKGSYAIVGWREGIGLCCGGYEVSIWDPTP